MLQKYFLELAFDKAQHPRNDQGEWTSSGNKTLYHGSHSEFQKFEKRYLGSSTGAEKR